jgi:hypothetical protein
VHTSGAGASTTSFDSTTNNFGSIQSTHGEGDDVFDVNGTTFSCGAIAIRNGNGATETLLDPTFQAFLTGNIDITNGDGNDRFEADGTLFLIASTGPRRNLTIRNGNGNSDTVFGTVASTVSISGNVAVTNGDGFDVFNTNGTFAVTGPGSLTIAHGRGGSQNNLTANIGAVGGALTFTSLEGRDELNLTRMTVGGRTTISTAGGNDTIQTHNSTFAAATIVTGAGRDEVLIESGTVDDGIGVTFNGIVNVNTGAGNDRVAIGFPGDTDDFGQFNAAVTISLGLDLDIVFAQANLANVFVVPPIISGFEQGT